MTVKPCSFWDKLLQNHCYHRRIIVGEPFIEQHGEFVDVPEETMVLRTGADICCRCGKRRILQQWYENADRPSPPLLQEDPGVGIKG